jgi:glycerophosphoryl diester phosphodiesterase
MPVYLTPTPGSMAKEMVILAKTYDAQILEIGFSSVDELRETRDHMRKLGVRLWLNTLDPVHSMDIFDSRAIEDPANVWGYAIRNGIGAIQTDHSAALAEYLGR